MAGRSFGCTTRYFAPTFSPVPFKALTSVTVGVQSHQCSTSARTLQTTCGLAEVTSVSTVRISFLIGFRVRLIQFYWCDSVDALFFRRDESLGSGPYSDYLTRGFGSQIDVAF